MNCTSNLKKNIQMKKFVIKVLLHSAQNGVSMSITQEVILCVCVCVYHQNIKLMIDACKFKSDQHSLTDKIVCDRQNCDCMIHRCDVTGQNLCRSIS